MTTVGRWSPNKVRARVLDGTWVAPEVLGGMVLIEPTSIAYTGTSASIGANGSVEFTDVTTLELRGVFSSQYDNYAIAITCNPNGYAYALLMQLLSGTTIETGTNYTRQYLFAQNTTIGAGRSTLTYQRLANSDNLATSLSFVYVYGPNLAQPTAFRTLRTRDSGGALIQNEAITHSVSNSYDGLSFLASSSALSSGSISIYGLVGA